MKLFSREHLAGDLWGGLASMLVALPASMAFGVAAYAALGTQAASRGALAGAVGAAAVGLVAPLLGGTDRLVSAPCAPAAAVMGAFALQLAAAGSGPERVGALLTLAALVSAALQILYGVLGGGTLIKYIPYPVVTGYLSGVGVVIFLKQLPSLFGWPYGTAAAHGLAHPGLWRAPALVVGIATILATAFAPRLTRRLPAAILGLGAGLASYFAMALARPELLQRAGNPFLVGPLGLSPAALGTAAAERFRALAGVGAADLWLALVPAATLSVVLSIDTLKTCVVVDALTRTRHDSNREVVGQGLANLTAALAGGLSGAGTSGATLRNWPAAGARGAPASAKGSSWSWPCWCWGRWWPGRRCRRWPASSSWWRHAWWTGAACGCSGSARPCSTSWWWPRWRWWR